MGSCITTCSSSLESSSLLGKKVVNSLEWVKWIVVETIPSVCTMKCGYAIYVKFKNPPTRRVFLSPFFGV